MSSGDDSDPQVSDDEGQEIKEENMMDSDDESNSDDEGDDEDAEEGDEDDEEDRPKKKRARGSRKGGGFIDEMANVGDDEEEEEEGDAYYQQRRDDDDDEARAPERHGRKYFQEFKERDDADIVADIEERAKRRDEYQHHSANIEQQNLLPSVRDPKLYTIPCKMGAEQETVVALMSKSVTLAQQGKPLKIKSVFYNPSIRGFVYVESYKEDYVVQACQGLRNLIMFRGKKAISSQALRLVPIKEMVQVMQASKKSAILKPGSWVRLKRGQYAGDLAQVVDPDEAQSRALLKIVPRIDLQAIAAKREAQKNPPPPGQPRKRQRRGARAAQRLFNFNDVLAAGGMVDHLADRVIIFNNKRYRDGYLYQWTNLDSMATMAVVPTLEELQLFEAKTARDPDAPPGSEGASGPMASVQSAVKRESSFCKGDVVRVLGGELKNLKGTIVSVKTDVDGQQLHVKPMLAALENQQLVFTPSEVVKFFKIGDHVEVLAGRHESETGFVTNVDGEFAFVFSELNKNEVKVFSSDCRLCEKTATGVDTLGKYALGDMVMIGTQNVGVIVRIDKEAVTVLTNNGAAQEVKHQQLGLKRSSRNAVALDQNNNQLALGDLCKLEQGPNKGKQGTVLHLFRSFVFLQSQEEVKNGGILVARSRHVALLGGKREQPQDMYMSHNPGSVLQSPSHSSFGMKGKGGGKGGKGKGKGKGMYGNDGLIGQKVLIKRGANKGYQGLVKDVTLMHVRIELVAKRKIVNINISGGKMNDMIEVMGGPGNMGGPGGPGNMGTQNQFAPPMTPGHADVMRTPAHGNDPLATPGGDNDAWDPDVGRTPAHDGGANWGASEGPGTPSFAGASPWGMGGMSPHEGGGYTPGGYTPGGHTPSSMDGGYGGFKSDYTPGPGTPGAFNPTPGPGTPGFNPTPGAGTPGTPGSSFTPGYGGNTPGFGQPADNDNWLVYATGVLVQIEQGEHAGKTGVIRSSEGMQAQVEVSGDMTVAVDIGQMTPVVPTKKDEVVVISDADKGGRGSLIGIDGEDGIVKMQPSLDIKILRLDSLAKLASGDH